MPIFHHSPEMEINYIILAHKNPAQLKKLVNRLNDPWVNFYIHLDKKSQISPKVFEGLKIRNITISKEEEVIWGDFSMVKATLQALTKIKKDNRTGYCVLLSGQDYPLKPNVYIRKFFDKAKDVNFIDIFSITRKENRFDLNRLNSYKINKSSKRGHFLYLNSIFQKDFYTFETLGKLNYLRKTKKWNEIYKIFRRRRHPYPLLPFGGSQWFALPVQTIRKILTFVNDHPHYVKYHQHTLVPDEIFFHSVLMNLEETKSLKIAPSLTYVNWKRKPGPLPVTFTTSDFEELKRASKNNLFARKFDFDKDEEVLNKIDKEFF